jgi:N-acetyl-anhydromuramoyl-L-alanine amidase
MSFSVDAATGLVAGAVYKASPNHNARPSASMISLLVIHNISLPPGHYEGDAIIDFFQNKLDHSQHPYFESIAGLKVSSHLLVRRTGVLYQFVPLHMRAWHAGISSFLGVPHCNDYSIGIELEGQDHEPYADAQYQVLGAVTRSIRQYAPAVTFDRIVGHQQIAPDRKTDPGVCFDWVYYRSLI